MRKNRFFKLITLRTFSTGNLNSQKHGVKLRAVSETEEASPHLQSSETNNTKEPRA